MAKTAKRKYTLPQILLLAVLLIATALYRYYYGGEQIISLEDIPEYSGEAYVAINGNQPFFTEADDHDLLHHVLVSPDVNRLSLLHVDLRILLVRKKRCRLDH